MREKEKEYLMPLWELSRSKDKENPAWVQWNPTDLQIRMSLKLTKLKSHVTLTII